MKSNILLGILFLGLTQGITAQKLMSRNGYIWFYSHTPIEDIVAHNRQAVSILDTETGAVQFSLLIKAFEFQKKLMQEHFNENYMESHIYPRASFDGKIENLSQIRFDANGVYPAQVSGELTIHGVTRQVSTAGTIAIKNGETSVSATFIVKPADYDITIPGIARNKIANEIQVNVEVTYN